MDSVELLMGVEDEFGLEISNLEAAKIERVGDLYAVVLKKLQQGGAAVDETQVWVRLCGNIAAQLGMRMEDVTPDVRFIEGLKMY
ncbi:MAG TPA: hypothetical protein VMB21_08315 [Candidatus Limnocylindria bacterium]|nr:hypothetical protein [Candidatus Limnocylindria bacterium]